MLYAIHKDYWYTMFIGEEKDSMMKNQIDMLTYFVALDDLPVRGPVGMVTDDAGTDDEDHVGHDPRWSHTYLYTHKNFAIEYNDDRVCRVWTKR